MSTSVEAFLAGFVQLLIKEREADVQRTALLFTNCSRKLLENKGLALGSLTVASVAVGLGGKSLIELERSLAYHLSQSFPPHTFRPGDLARIEDHAQDSNHNKSNKKAEVEGTGVDGIVYKISDTRIILSVESTDGIELPERCRLLKLANTVTYDRMDKILQTLMGMFVPGSVSPAPKGLPTVNSLHRVLLGLQNLGNLQPDACASLRWFGEGLNESQRDAVRFALCSPEVACIWGPPGTGKTHTLIELILQLLSRGLRVLVCGASNLSVDNILERLLDLPKKQHAQPLPEMHLLRISHPARTLSHLVPATLDFQLKHSDGGELVRDCKTELEEKISALTSKKPRGSKAKSGKMRLSKDERKKGWEEVRQLRKEYRMRESKVLKEIVGNSNVVLSTCHSAGSRQLYGEQFDVLIIDEVTQAMEPVCWVPLLKARKLVLAGDPMQLPPTVLSDNEYKQSPKLSSAKKGKDKNSQEPHNTSVNHINDSLESDEQEVSTSKRKHSSATDLVLHPPRSLSTTMFARLERLHGKRIKTLLKVQYRMNSKIAAFPSKELYESSLVDHASVKDHLLQDLVHGSAHEMLQEPLIFFDTAGHSFFEKTEAEGDALDEGSKCNENEASIVVRWVNKLINIGITPEQIAIVTPYQAQVQLLSSLLRPQYPDIEIGSVDGMQGREQEVVILSMVRSNAQREVGFLKDIRRLNVAMTRAKRQLCVVGDSQTVKAGGEYLTHWMDWLETEAEIHFPDEEL